MSNHNPATNPLLMTARQYLNQGFSVIPLKPHSKEPLVAWKEFQARKATVEELTEWWRKWPNANVGIITGAISNIVVIDIDGDEGRASVDALHLPKTHTVITANGRHAYFKHPGFTVATNAGVLGDGIDVRGDGGYIVAPPSIHPNGTAYFWETPLTENCGFSQLTDGLASRMRAYKSDEVRGRGEAYANAALARETSAVLTSPPGQRNDRLNEAAFNLGQLVAGGELTTEQVNHELIAACSHNGLMQEDGLIAIERTISSGVAAGMTAPRNAPPPLFGNIGNFGINKTPSGSTTTKFECLDMSVLDETLTPPPSFPTEVLGKFWADFSIRAAQQAGSPIDYIISSLLVMTAAMIGNSRVVVAWGEWREAIVLWFANVGRPSSGKSSGQRVVFPMVHSLETELAKLPNVEGNPRRISISDTTHEAAAELLSEQPYGLLVVRDELAGWFLGFNRYSGKGERAFWLECYSGGRNTIDRVKHDAPIVINHCSMSVIGSIQPEVLSETLLKGPDDGFMSRLICIWPESIPPTRPTKKAPMNLAKNYLRKLLALKIVRDNMGTLAPVERHLEEAAQQVFQEWREAHHKESEDVTGLLASHYGKMPGLVLRMSLILEYMWWIEGNENEPTGISLRALNASIRLFQDYFKPMAKRTLGNASKPRHEINARTLAKWIKQSKVRLINARDVRRNEHLPGLSKSADMDRAISELVEAGWLRPADNAASPYQGRNPKTFEVNPQVFKE